MGRPELGADPRFAPALARVTNQDLLDPIIGAWTGGFLLENLEPMLQSSDVPASRVFTMADIFRDPHFAARNAIVHVDDEQLGSVAMAAPVPKLSETPGEVTHCGREIGADTSAVLRRLAGMTQQEIDELLDAGIVFDAKHSPRQPGSGQPRRPDVAIADPT